MTEAQGVELLAVMNRQAVALDWLFYLGCWLLFFVVIAAVRLGDR